MGHGWSVLTCYVNFQVKTVCELKLFFSKDLIKGFLILLGCKLYLNISPHNNLELSLG